MSATLAYSSSHHSVDATHDSAQLRKTMIVTQLRTNRVYNESVLAAFAAVPRENFVAENVQHTAYLDEDLPAGMPATVAERYTMEPMVLARLLEAANIQPTEKVLLIGANGGYEAAILANLSLDVIVLEDDPVVYQTAAARLADINGITMLNCPMTEGPLATGCEAKGPFAVIIINGAVANIPANFTKGLNDGGRLLAVRRPVASTNGQATIVRCHQGNCASQPLFDANCPYLTGFTPVTDAFTF